MTRDKTDQIEPACEERGITTCIPANRAVNNQGKGAQFDRRAFSHDPESDTLRCPAGATLVRKQQHHRERLTIYTANLADCAGCTLKPGCTQAQRRLVSRHWDDQVLDERMHARATPAMMALRRCTVERPLAELKYRILGLPRLLLRGLNGARTEGSGSDGL